MAPSIRHRLQSQWDTPTGFVLARTGWYATWDVVVIDRHAHRVVATHGTRAAAEVHAAELAEVDRHGKPLSTPPPGRTTPTGDTP